MKLTAFMLCDSASVRESLLHVLGAGITRVSRPRYPALMGLSVAILLESDSNDIGASLGGEVRLLGDDSDEPIMSVSLGIEPREEHLIDPNLPSTIPLAISLDQISLPKPGSYKIVFSLDEKVLASLEFEAVEGQ